MEHDLVKSKPQDGTTSESQALGLKGLRTRAKLAASKTVHLESSDTDVAYDEALEQLNESPAFNPQKFLSGIDNSSLPSKAVAFVRGIAQAITDPKAAIKHHATRKAAKKLAKSRPYLSKKADLDFLDAHDDLSRAENKKQAGMDDREVDGVDGDINHCTRHIARLERSRQEMRVAWVTKRHVQRVRAIDATLLPPFPDNSFFQEKDDCGQMKFKWGTWFVYKLLYGSHSFTAQYIDDFVELPFDIETLRKHIERLVIVSAPLQEMILEVRHIYRWENPARTGRWLLLYFFLWYISHIMTFLYGYITYSVIMNYYYPHSLEELRDSIKRTVDRSATALKIGELMDKHGSDEWLGPLLDELGPYIQLQIADLVSFLEICYNFYHFRSPSTTVHSLCFFTALFLTSFFVDARFALKLFWLIVGLVFFVCWPVSSLYPQYRLLVSPFKWAFWNVPNHAEWSFEYLQGRSVTITQSILEAQAFNDDLKYEIEVDTPQNISDNSDSDDSMENSDASSFDAAQVEISKNDISRFACTYHNVPGHLTISIDGLRFSSRAGRFVPIPTFHRLYSDLIEMKKLQADSTIVRPLAKITAGLDKLEMRFKGRNRSATCDPGEENTVLLENMRGRDKAFNTIIAFSRRRWQHLQRLPV